MKGLSLGPIAGMFRCHFAWALVRLVLLLGLIAPHIAPSLACYQAGSYTTPQDSIRTSVVTLAESDSAPAIPPRPSDSTPDRDAAQGCEIRASAPPAANNLVAGLGMILPEGQILAAPLGLGGNRFPSSPTPPAPYISPPEKPPDLAA